MSNGSVNSDETNFYISGRIDQGLLFFQIKDCPVNIISEVVVERLGFEVFDLLDPYEINYNREVKQVTKGTKLTYSTGKLREEILCDVADIDDCHVCLGEPWKISHGARYSGSRDVYYLSVERMVIRPEPPERVQEGREVVRSSVQRWRTRKEAATLTSDHFEEVKEVSEEEDAHVESKATEGMSDDEGSEESIDTVINEEEVIGEELPSLMMGDDTGNMSLSPYVIDPIPCVSTFEATEYFKFSYVPLPTFYPLYYDVLMELPSMRGYYDCILPKGYFVIFIEVRWSIQDEVLSDILPMSTAHVLLERPWPFDRRVIYDDYFSNYVLKQPDTNVLLHPMTPREVRIDRNQLGVASGKGDMFIKRLITIPKIDKDGGCCEEEMRVKHLRSIYTSEENFQLYPPNLSLQVFQGMGLDTNLQAMLFTLSDLRTNLHQPWADDGNQTVQFTGSTTQVRIQEILKSLLRITSDSKELDKRFNQIRRWMKAGLKLAALTRCKWEKSAFEGARGGVEGRLKAGGLEPV